MIIWNTQVEGKKSFGKLLIHPVYIINHRMALYNLTSTVDSYLG